MNSDKFTMTIGAMLTYSLSVMLLDNKPGFNWKQVVLYASPYEEGKQSFVEELHSVMSNWNGPILIGGDFNLVRFATEKSNGIINHRWADAFNDWISKWALLELNPSNKLFTWTNNQENLVMAKLDRIFVTMDWEPLWLE